MLVNHLLPSNSHFIRLHLPKIRDFHIAFGSRNGWVLVRKFWGSSALLLNPFTRNHLSLPSGLNYHDGNCFGFSAPPTSPSCVVMECVHLASSPIVINTWRPGDTAWTVHQFEDRKRRRKWDKCVFSNGVFYCLSTRGHIGVFDPSKVTWNILPVKPLHAFNNSGYVEPVLLAEHAGDIFVIFTNKTDKPLVFRLNLERGVWEEKRDLGGLTVFASDHASSLVVAGLSAEERNKVYRSRIHFSSLCQNYSFVGGKRGAPLVQSCIDYVEPPTSINCLT